MNYKDLININDFEKRENFNYERWWVAFYCKDCEEIVETYRKNQDWYIFVCKKCAWTNIVIWTLEWLKENYKIKDK